MNQMEKKYKSKKKFEDVLKFLIPYYRFFTIKSFKKEDLELKDKINQGIEKGLIKFNNNFKIDLKKLEKEKGKEWVEILKKQLKILSQTFENKKLN